MKQEEEQLLLRDLCARLPYGVKCENFNHVYGKNIFKVTDIRDNGYICGVINSKHCWSVPDPLELKPYLFPLSSMTEEQKEEYNLECKKDLKTLSEAVLNRTYTKTRIETPLYYGIDWLNANHFDYRGLIPMGLAIDCTNLNIY